MTLLLSAWENLVSFVELGGTVLIAIFVVTLVMWTLILERTYYIRWVYPRTAETHRDIWRQRADRASWSARQQRRRTMSEASLKLERSLPIIKTLVAVCPLLGLLGTVTGMIEVFDVMAMTGSGNPRAMAAGVSSATIPTMAGMVAALSGLFFSVRLGRLAHREARKLEVQLTLN